MNNFELGAYYNCVAYSSRVDKLRGIICVFRSCSVMEQLILKAVVAEFLRTGVEEAQFGRVMDQFVSLCRFDGKY